jgi:hypothetical protein
MINDDLCWAWALAARAADDLGDTATARELIAPLDSYQPGQLAPMLRAERDLARARLAASDPAADVSFTSAIGRLRELSTPYHLAHGLLDHARHLLRRRDTEAAEAAIGEARDIARNLRCQPLLDRAATITPAKSPIQDQIAALPHLEASPAAAKVTPASGADHNQQGTPRLIVLARLRRQLARGKTDQNGGSRAFASILRMAAPATLGEDCHWVSNPPTADVPAR